MPEVIAISETNPDLRGVFLRRYWECGPLLLDTQKSRATLDDVDLELDEEAFTALYLLVQRVGEGMTFEELYKAVWEPLDGADRRKEAWAAMKELVEKVADKRKDVWIKVLSEKVFVLQQNHAIDSLKDMSI